MDKQTGSNSSSRGTSESHDIGLGCGPSSSQASSTTAASATSPAAAGSADGGASGSSEFATLATQPQHQHHTVLAPSGAPVPGVVGTTQSQQTTPPPITLNINTTTGGNFSVIVDTLNSVENLRKVIAKKLKVAKDRICLLHREKELQEGTLKDNGLMDGSRIILIPNVETGLLAQRPENTVMQALESLNDSQVNDFLSGKTPLNLSMRLGDHMMLIQLQLSTVNPVNAAGHGNSGSSRTRSNQRSSRSSLSSSTTSAQSTGHNHHSHHHHHHHHHGNSAAATSTSAVASPSATASRKLNIDTANAALIAQTSHRQRMSSVSTMPSLRLPAPAGSSIRGSDLSSFLSKRDYESLQNIVRSIAMAQPTKMAPPPTTATVGAVQSEPIPAGCSKAIDPGCTVTNSAATTAAAAAAFNASEPALLEQSPIKSLSNLVSSPIKTAAIKNIPITNSGNSSSSSTTMATPAVDTPAVATCQDPISAKLTSCLCTRLNSTGANTSSAALKSCIESSCQSRQESTEIGISESRASMLTSTPSKFSSSSTVAGASPSASLLHKTANNPILRSKHRHHHHHHHHHHHYHHHGSSSNGAGASTSMRKLPVSPRSTSVVSTSTNDSGFISENDNSTAGTVIPQQTPPTAATSTTVDLDDSGVTLTDSRTLAEASRNLTQTLRKLSKEVFTNKIDLSSEETPRKSSSGAVIESMKNHGKGIYSGTFSGTLNPALQDRYGRPKRDISTVIHILNDLLSATPQYSRGARISFEAPSTSSAAATAGSASGHASRNKHYPSKHHHHSYAYGTDSCVKCSKTQNQHAASSSSACAYGECNGHYASSSSSSNKQTKHVASYACCQDVSVASSSHQQPTDANNTNDRNTCSCRYRIHSESGDREREHMCQKCLVEMENSKTKSKLDQLRLVMQQRKQKREARKLKGAPYGARVVGATTGLAAADAAAAVTVTGSGVTSNSTSTPLATTPLATASPSEAPPNHIVEEVDTAA